MAERGGRRRERGAAAVEFALVLPVLLALVLGTIDWGFHFMRREVVVNAAREGARAGSIADEALADDAARTRAREYLDSAGIDNSSCSVDVLIDAAASVTVTCGGGSMTGFLTGLLPANIVAQAVMRR